MSFDPATGNEFALASFVLASNTAGGSLCYFDERRNGPLSCLPELLRGDAPFVGEIVNETFFYAAGLGGGEPLYRVRDLGTATPVFEDVGFVIPQDAGVPQVADVTHVDQRECAGGCVTTDVDASSFLVALVRNANGILLVALDQDLTPTYCPVPQTPPFLSRLSRRLFFCSSCRPSDGAPRDNIHIATLPSQAIPSGSWRRRDERGRHRQ